MTHTPPRGTPRRDKPEPSNEARSGSPASFPDTAASGARPRTNVDDVYRLLAESVQDYAIFALDATGRVLTWSAGAARLKGYARTEIVGQHFSLFYPPEAIAAGKPERELELAKRAGRLEDEGWRVRKDGSQFWANVVISAMRNPAG
jgi:PAS domain S-box-containing protein